MSFRILSLDGGGTWALLEAMALEDLYPGYTGHQILRQFDLAVANSGGSIVLAGLMLDMSPTTIRSFFEDQTKRDSIFYKKPFEPIMAALPIPIPRYVAAQKRIGLGNAFGAPGNTRLADWPNIPGWPRGPCGQPVRILIMAFDYDRQREDFLRSYKIDGTGAEAEPVALVDAVHASTNAPVLYFDGPALVSPKRYWDGAMGGYNNPVMAGVVDAIALNFQPSSIAALTLGTGTVRLAPADMVTPATPHSLYQPLSTSELFGDAKLAAGCITDDPPDAATFVTHIVLGNKPSEVGRVIRMSPVIQPVINGAGEWDFPPGLPQLLFDPLSKLGMDAVEPQDVNLLQQLGQAWLTDDVSNQPIRMGDDLSCQLGHPKYSMAKAAWKAI